MPEWLETKTAPGFAWQLPAPPQFLHKVQADREAGRVSDAEILRDQPGRLTLFMSLAGRASVVKIHSGPGWREVFKNLLCFRWPVLDAGNEWRGLRRLRQLNIPAPLALAMARSGRNPAARTSYIVMSRLQDTLSLEDVCAAWTASPPPAEFRFFLTREIARICRIMHGSGMAHRDCYLCHFHLQEPGRILHLIDLHRALVGRKVSRRWRVKDLAGLLFSALDTGLARRDLYRFMCSYSESSLKETLSRDRHFWRAVWRRAKRDCHRLSDKPWPFGQDV